MPSANTQEEIIHRGTVLRLVGLHQVKVQLTDASECDACAVAALCGAGGKKGASYIEADVPPHMKIRVGDKVEVAGTERLHRKAIRLATVYPTIAILAVMTGIYLLTTSQLAAALSGLCTMVFFFILLWCFRNKIAHEFTFVVKKALATGEINK